MHGRDGTDTVRDEPNLVVYMSQYRVRWQAGEEDASGSAALGKRRTGNIQSVPVQMMEIAVVIQKERQDEQ